MCFYSASCLVRRILVLAFMLVALGSTGCKTWRNVPLPWTAKTQDSDDPKLAEILADADWQHRPDTEDDSPYRWQNKSLNTALQAITDEELENHLDDEATERTGTVAATAAIILARRGYSVAADQLLTLAQSSRTPVALRCAAMETWRLRERGEEPPTPLPEGIVALASDHNAAVRSECLHLLVATRNPRAIDYLQQAAGETDVRVRLVAAETLGEISGQADQAQAQALLLTILKNEGELLRAAAVSSLAKLGDYQAVLDAATDVKWRVRAEVALALADMPPRQATPVARELLRDASILVHRRTVQAMESWPLEHAGPVLLAAIDECGYTVRQAAVEQLEQRWPPAKGFPLGAAATVREKSFQSLREEWAEQHPVHFAATTVSHTTQAPLAASKETVDAQLLSQVQLLLPVLSNSQAIAAARQQAVSQLQQLGSAAIDALEHVAVQQNRELPEAVYTDALPQMNRQFELLRQMQGAQPDTRRGALNKLADERSGEPLRPLVVQRLVWLAVRDQDPSVWRTAMTLLEKDSRPSVKHFFLAGCTHPDPEVRRRACVYLGNFPQPEYIKFLGVATQDEDAGVARAAVISFGRCGSPENPNGQYFLKQLLGSDDPTLLVEVATALTRLGDEGGDAAFERLAHHGDPGIRRLTALRLGELALHRHSGLLLAMLDDARLGVRSAALDSLPRVTGHKVPPRQDGAPRDSQESIIYWKQWKAEPEKQDDPQQEGQRDPNAPTPHCGSGSM